MESSGMSPAGLDPLSLQMSGFLDEHAGGAYHRRWFVLASGKLGHSDQQDTPILRWYHSARLSPAQRPKMLSRLSGEQLADDSDRTNVFKVLCRDAADDDQVCVTSKHYSVAANGVNVWGAGGGIVSPG